MKTDLVKQRIKFKRLARESYQLGDIQSYKKYNKLQLELKSSINEISGTISKFNGLEKNQLHVFSALKLIKRKENEN